LLPTPLSLPDRRFLVLRIFVPKAAKSKPHLPPVIDWMENPDIL